MNQESLKSAYAQNEALRAICDHMAGSGPKSNRNQAPSNSTQSYERRGGFKTKRGYRRFSGARTSGLRNVR
jgi:hypothetical protein